MQLPRRVTESQFFLKNCWRKLGSVRLHSLELSQKPLASPLSDGGQKTHFLYLCVPSPLALPQISRCINRVSRTTFPEQAWLCDGCFGRYKRHSEIQEMTNQLCDGLNSYSGPVHILQNSFRWDPIPEASAQSWRQGALQELFPPRFP